MVEMETIYRQVPASRVKPARKSLGVAALIPALNPGEDLITLVSELQEVGFAPIILIDDGSDDSCSDVFDFLSTVPGVDVLRHAVNLGKGRALKTGFNYFLVNYPNSAGVVTIDADGQHLPEDAVAVAETLLRNPRNLVLGCRVFGEGVPWKSKVGNIFTRSLFRFFAGKRISDTQTGLRGISRSAIGPMLALAGERYEFEMGMLVNSSQFADDVVEQPIQTIYINGNKASHFNPVLDSMRVTFVLARFYLSSLLASGIDLGVFALAFRLSSNLFASLMLSRFFVGGVVNFLINRSFVFHNRNEVRNALLKYYVLLVFSGVVSYFLIKTAVDITSWNILLCKILVDVPLSLFNFSVQRTFIFGRNTEAEVDAQ
jgi:glycosyltransferase involved in cell wall biosynthesis